MKTEICFDCYRIMDKKEEIIKNDHRIFIGERKTGRRADREGQRVTERVKNEHTGTNGNRTNRKNGEGL